MKTKFKNLIKQLEWSYDYYFLYFLYNPNKIHRYHRYMLEKWGDKYKNKIN